MQQIIFTTATATLLVMSSAAAAQTSASAGAPWPQRPVRIVVGFPPGGGIDVVARLLAVPLTERFGQQVIVDNRPGANGIVGMDVVEIGRASWRERV